MAEDTNKIYYCPIELSLELVGSKWKPAVLRYLGHGAQAVGDLRRRVPLVTRKALDALLAELVREGLAEKILHSDVRDREEYQLTEDGEALRPVLDQLALFGRELAERRSLPLVDSEPEIASLAAGADAASADAAGVETAGAAGRWPAWSWLPL